MAKAVTIDPGTWPKWEVRLDADPQDHPSLRGQFRVTTLRAPTADHAEEACLRMEYRRAAYELAAADAAKLEDLDAKGKLPRGHADRARLLAHRQTRPYVVASVKKTADPVR